MIDKLRAALEALDVATTPLAKDRQEILSAREGLRSVIAEMEAVEPVGIVIGFDDATGNAIVDHACEPVSVLEVGMAIYASAPQAKQLVPLTDSQLSSLMEKVDFPYCPTKFARAIEAAHNIK